MDHEQLDDLTAQLRAVAAQLGDTPRSEYAPLLLTLDQGGHASRALVFDVHGNQVAQAFAPITTQRPTTDRVEHVASDILESLQQVVTDVAETLGRDVDRLIAAGLATQRSSIVCWDRLTHAALSPVLSWQDRRNVALTDALALHRDDIQSLTGLVLSPHYGASKLRWCLEHLPNVQQAQQHGSLLMGPLSSYLLHGLLDEHPHLVDPANASRTLLWSPSARDWHPQLLEWFGVPAQVLPQCVPSTHAFGTLNVGGARVPLTLCTGDQAAVPFASGPLKDDALYLNLGTGAFLLAPLTHDIEHAAPLLRSVLWSDDTQIRYALEGTVNGAGSALDWFAERSGIDVPRALRALTPSSTPPLQWPSYAQDAAIPVFINGVGGVGSPFWLPQIESRFVTAEGQPLSLQAQAREDTMLLAVLESIAFLIAANVTLMRSREPRLRRLIVGGGLSASAYLCECIAAVCDLPLERLTEPELTARGIANLLKGGSHETPLPCNIEGGVDHFSPDTVRLDRHGLLQRQQQWQACMRALLPIQ